MAEVNAPQGNIVAQASGTTENTVQPDADPSTSSTATATPEAGKQAEAVPAGSGAGGVSSASTADTEAIEADAQKVIATWSAKAGLGELKGDGSHQSNVANATSVFVKLTQLGMKTEIPKFLNALASAGKGLYNWGLKLDGVPLNELKAFRGVDATRGSSQPQGENTSQTGTSTTASSGKGMSPDQVPAMVTPLLREIAALDKNENGNANTISLADLKEAAKDKDKYPEKLVGLLESKIKPGSDMTVDAAADHVKVMAASQKGSTQQTQAPQGEPKTEQPEPLQQQQPQVAVG